ncbi:cytochrome c biogenesis protein CcdA [Sphingomonas sp.]|uniref:cytochrome c biogenesis CcdA family protein n=1 Tax=Sphingomonas sp. TaxID=28214 RepID=UPI0017B8773C|nr:cytochrome c biogenesis protein CcdA [Sphingomonas sp.]MBA3511111.1 thiol:disulfide interchange protein [Sphingomonas sp.]
MNFSDLLQSLGTGSHTPLQAALITFLAGVLASAVCPCTVPVGIGLASAASASEAGHRRDGMIVAVAFFVGIVGSLTVLGALAGQLGAMATESFGRSWALVMSLLSLAAAIAALLLPRMGGGRLPQWRRPGAAGAFLYGLVFSVGTSVAPLLLLLTVSAAVANAVGGVVLAFIFGLGRGLPFLLAGVAGSAMSRFLRLHVSRSLQIVSAAALLFVSGYYGHVYYQLL